ncbi:hypothetical protein BD413DRAFT_181575 [Trametes elegans]|nr:hypothetical protein BD413DRAFT_181575 [Trametes elegans]
MYHRTTLPLQTSARIACYLPLPPTSQTCSHIVPAASVASRITVQHRFALLFSAVIAPRELVPPQRSSPRREPHRVFLPFPVLAVHVRRVPTVQRHRYVTLRLRCFRRFSHAPLPDSLWGRTSPASSRLLRGVWLGPYASALPLPLPCLTSFCAHGSCRGRPRRLAAASHRDVLARAGHRRRDEHMPPSPLLLPFVLLPLRSFRSLRILPPCTTLHGQLADHPLRLLAGADVRRVCVAVARGHAGKLTSPPAHLRESATGRVGDLPRVAADVRRLPSPGCAATSGTLGWVAGCWG